ncbi:MAG: hypothetical protein ACMG6E_08885, partial [Candidatus Roizmanbacteria bacterium]
ERGLSHLSKDRLVESGDTGILIFVNRPNGYSPDNTSDKAQQMIQKLNINGIIIESDIPSTLGNSKGPFNAEMATGENDVAIGLIRDMLNIAAMKLAIQDGCDLPPILQMDVDFEGFMKGSCEDILFRFRDPDLTFLQCTSDWDSQECPRTNYPALLLGTELMRELPQILKMPLNDILLPQETRKQILFGEAIQRGIQVPQVERMEDIAKKGGYGLNRLAHDELDANIRQSAVNNTSGVRSSSDIVFLWNNRRAVRSWREYRQPAISQWVSPFSVIDPVRLKENGYCLTEQAHSEEVINKSLARFPIPYKLTGVYSNFIEPIKGVLACYFPEMQNISTYFRQASSGLYYLQVNLLS